MFGSTVTGVNETLQSLRNMHEKQLPFAAAKALTNTVRAVQIAETKHIADIFNNPTSFTRRAVGFTPATKTSLIATVFVKDAQAKYLKAEVTGGKREFKTFEQRFTERAPGGPQVALPGAGITLNQYGNITKAQIKRIARDLNTSGKSKRYFMGTPKGQNLPSGIYARVNENHHLAPLMIFAKAATYQKRFMFSELAKETIDATFEKNLVDAWAAAIKTARP